MGRSIRRFFQAAIQLVKHNRLNPTIQGNIFLGLFILVTAFATLWHVALIPILIGYPTNFSYTANVVSRNNYYSETTGYQGVQTNNVTFSYKTTAVKGDTLYIKNSFETFPSNTNTDLNRSETYAINRQSGQYVPGGNLSRNGYLFAPRNLHKQDITYWHVEYDTPIELHYVDTEDVLGLQTYLYEARFTADETQDLTGAAPAIGTTEGARGDVVMRVWFEPTTGYLVKYEGQATNYLYDMATKKTVNPWSQHSDQYTFDSIVAQVQKAEALRVRQEYINVWLPVAFWISAVVLFVAWLSILWSTRWKPRHPRQVVIRTLALLVGLIGLMILSVWLIQRPALLRPSLSFASTHPINTVVLIMLSASTLMAAHSTKVRRKLRVASLALLGLAIALPILYFCQYFGQGHHLDAWLIGWGLQPIAEISPATEIGLLSVSLAMLLTHFKQRRPVSRLARLLLLIALVPALAAIAGYAFNLDYLHSLRWFNAMALTSAIAILLLVITVFASQPTWPATRIAAALSPSIRYSLILIALTLTFTGVVRQQVTTSTERKNNIQFQSDTSSIQASVNNEFSSYIKALRSGSALFAASDNVTRAEWITFVNTVQLRENYPGVLGMGYTIVFPAAQKAAVEAQIRSEGFPTYTTTPAGSRPMYSAIIYLEPFDAINQRAFGYDMYSEPTRREAMDAARDSGQPAMSHHVTLVQEASADPQAGTLIYVPVYKKGMPHATIDQRRSALQGFVYMPLRMTDFMQSTLGEQTFGLNIELFDTDNPDAISTANRVYATDDTHGLGSDYQPHFSSAHAIQVADRTFVLRYSSLPGYEASTNNPLAATTLYGGITISILLGAFTFSLSSSRDRARILAAKMTQSLRAERNLAIDTQHKNQAVLSSIGDGVVVVNPSGTIVLFNQAAQKVSKYLPHEAIGRHYTSVLKLHDEHTQKPLGDILPLVLKRKISSKTLYALLHTKEDTMLPVALKITPVLDKNRAILGAVVVCRDVTHEKQLERTKDEFLSIASHELRTPMGAIRAYASMILGGDYGPVNKRLKDPLTDIRTSTIRLVDLVNDLLDVNRLETGRMKTQISDFDIKKTLDEIVSEYQPLCHERGITIAATAKEGTLVQGDLEKVKGAITNLVGNAVKFTAHDGITITAHVQKDKMIVEVKDTGIGIPHEEWPKLFNKFQQLSAQEAGKPAGTGLGLYIAKMTIETLGGELWIKSSAVGKGTTFAFSLPLAGTPRAKVVKKSLEKA
ncbi:MAG TPA: porin PorA family protein [Candidatus Saccharimonadales bacterium]